MWNRHSVDIPRPKHTRKSPDRKSGPGHGRHYESNAMQSKNLITTHTAQQYLSCSRTTIFRLVKAGHLNQIHIGRAVRFQLDEIERLAQHGTKPATAA